MAQLQGKPGTACCGSNVVMPLLHQHIVVSDPPPMDHLKLPFALGDDGMIGIVTNHKRYADAVAMAAELLEPRVFDYKIFANEGTRARLTLARFNEAVVSCGATKIKDQSQLLAIIPSMRRLSTARYSRYTMDPSVRKRIAVSFADEMIRCIWCEPIDLVSTGEPITGSHYARPMIHIERFADDNFVVTAIIGMVELTGKPVMTNFNGFVTGVIAAFFPMLGVVETMAHVPLVYASTFRMRTSVPVHRDHKEDGNFCVTPIGYEL